MGSSASVGQDETSSMENYRFLEDSDSDEGDVRACDPSVSPPFTRKRNNVVSELDVLEDIEDCDLTSTNREMREIENYLRNKMYDEARQSLEVFIDSQLRLDEYDTRLIRYMTQLALIYHKMQQLPKSLIILEECVDLSKKICGNNHEDTLDCMDNLVTQLIELKRFPEAEKWLKSCIEVSSKISTCKTLDYLDKLATIYNAQLKFQEAESLYVYILKQGARVFGKTHEVTLVAMNQLGQFYVERRRYQEAEILLIQCLKLRKSKYGNEDRETCQAMNNLAMLYCDLEMYTKAEELMIGAYNISVKMLGESHPDCIDMKQNLDHFYDYYM